MNPAEERYPEYDVLIRNNATGEVRKRHVDFPWHDASHFWWTEGNFGCDCNRFLEFERAGGAKIQPEGNEVCGTTAYTVIRAIMPGGTEIVINRP